MLEELLKQLSSTYSFVDLFLFAQTIVEYFEGRVKEKNEEEALGESRYFITEVDIAFDILRYEIFFEEGRINRITEQNDYNNVDLEAFRLINLCIADRFRRC